MLAQWLGNKTPEIFASWIAQAGNSVLVAIEDGDIQAVGAVTDTGNITLNYVSPDARFHGVSRGLLGALEARAAERGNTRCTLTSTETAWRFYLANGYAEDAQTAGNSGTSSGYPMSRVLAPHPNRGPARPSVSRRGISGGSTARARRTISTSIGRAGPPLVLPLERVDAQIVEEFIDLARQGFRRRSQVAGSREHR